MEKENKRIIEVNGVKIKETENKIIEVPVVTVDDFYNDEKNIDSS